MKTTRQHDRDAFARRLNEAMIGAGLTSSELARQLGRSPRAIHGWVNGEHIPNNAVMHKLAAALGTDPVQLALGKNGGRRRL